MVFKICNVIKQAKCCIYTKPSGFRGPYIHEKMSKVRASHIVDNEIKRERE